MGAFGDSLVGGGAVGVGGYSKVVGGSEGDESVLDADDDCEEDDEGLVEAIGAYSPNELEVVLAILFWFGRRLLHDILSIMILLYYQKISNW